MSEVIASSCFTVGLAGPSGSGKSTVAHKLIQACPATEVLQLDWYFLPPDKMGPHDSYYDIACYDWQQFLYDVNTLRTGRSVLVPQVEFVNFTRTPKRLITPKKSLIIDGMALYRIPGIHDLLDISFYLNPPQATLISRKVGRDMTERQRSLSEVGDQLRWIMLEWRREISSLPSAVHLIEAEEPIEQIMGILKARFRPEPLL